MPCIFVFLCLYIGYIRVSRQGRRLGGMVVDVWQHLQTGHWDWFWIPGCRDGDGGLSLCFILHRWKARKGRLRRDILYTRYICY